MSAGSSTRDMTAEQHTDAVQEEEQARSTEHTAAEERGGVFSAVLRGLLYPFRMVARAYREFLWLLGFRQPKEKALTYQAVSSPSRQNLTGRKRLHWSTRLLLHILPRWLQGALGFPVSSSIGRSLSPEIRVSPTKPCGKGSKRKQDDIDEEDEEEQQTWVEVLTQDLAEDEEPDEDPDYEPHSVSTESEEYCSHNNTESDLEVHGKGVVVIEDVCVDVQVPAPVENPAV